MLKQIFLIIFASIVIIFFTPFLQHVLHMIVASHDWINNQLKQVFSVGEAGRIIRELLAMLAVPVLVSIFPAAIYWLIKRAWFPWTLEIIWVVWLMQATAIVQRYIEIVK
jgi:hypothetical protein